MVQKKKRQPKPKEAAHAVSADDADCVHLLQCAAMGADGEGTISHLKKLMEKPEMRACLNGRGPNGNTALIMACISGRTEAVEYLLTFEDLDINKKGFPVNLPKHRVTALSMAVFNGRTEVVRLLLRHKNINVNCVSFLREVWCTPLLLAMNIIDLESRSVNNEIIQMLIESKDIDVNYEAQLQDNRTTSPLNFAARKGYTTAAKLLLSHPDIRVNDTDFSGDTPLSHAVLGGIDGWDAEMVRLLMSHKDIDVNLKTGAPGQCESEMLTPLLLAVSCGTDGEFNINNEVIQVLLEDKNIDVNTKGNMEGLQGVTPLHMCAYYGHIKAAQLLLAHKNIQVNINEAAGCSPLSVAVGRGQPQHLETVKLLLSHKDVDVNKLNIVRVQCNCMSNSINGKDHIIPALTAAATLGAVKIVKLLLDHEGIDVNREDSNGETALSFAVKVRKPEVVKVLLSDGRIKVNVKKLLQYMLQMREVRSW